MSCTAYTKQHRRCGAKVHGESVVCKAHVNYYKDWFSKHPPIYGFYKRDEIMNYRPTYEYVDVLKSGRVVPSRSYVYRLGNEVMYYSYYILLCRYSEKVNPLWNEKLFHEVIACYFHRCVKEKRELAEFIKLCNIMAKSPAAVYLIYEVLIYESTLAVLDTSNDIQHILEGIWELLYEQDFWSSVYFNNVMETSLTTHIEYLHTEYKNDDIDDYQYEESVQLVLNFFKPILRSWNEMAVGTLRSRIEPYKEELIAAAWHPRRVQAWLEYYGDDVFDYL